MKIKPKKRQLDTFQGISQSLLDEILQDIHEALKDGAKSKSEKEIANQKVCMLQKKEIYDLIDDLVLQKMAEPKEGLKRKQIMKENIKSKLEEATLIEGKRHNFQDYARRK